MKPERRFRSGVRVALACLVFLVIVTALGTTGRLPKWLAACYLIMSLVSFCAYWLDKFRAGGDGVRRTPERKLLLCDALFGWPGGLAAQQYLRHKNRKASYQRRFWVIVAGHLVGLLAVSM